MVEEEEDLTIARAAAEEPGLEEDTIEVIGKAEEEEDN